MGDLVRQTSAAVVFPCYTRAPDRQYPTQFEESFAVFRHILDQAEELGLDSNGVALAGDGAGGISLFLSIFISFLDGF